MFTRLNTNYPIIGFIMKRLLTLIPIMFGVSFITFALMYIAPNDPVEMMLQAQGIPVSPDVIAAMQEELGLNRPFLSQYFMWLGNILQGDLGVSLVDGVPVGQKLAAALPQTMILTLCAVLVTLLLALPLGFCAALMRGRGADRLIRGLAFLSNSVPSFFLSLLLIYFVAIHLGLLPVMVDAGPAGLILPTLALAIPLAGRYARQVRGAVLEELAKPHIKGALSRGIPKRIVFCRSVLKGIAATLLTLLSQSVGQLLGGTVAVERIFIWRGLGYLTIDAILMGDYPVIQAIVLWMSALFVVINLITDLLYLVVDPRMRKGLGVS